MASLRKPTKEEIQAAIGETMIDVIAPDLKVLFCGINPSLYSAVVGHHFARPGNRFWPTLHQAGFTDRLFNPAEDRDLLKLGYGITNVVDRATATADELSKQELLIGGQNLAAKVEQYRPCCLAILGIGAYRTAFGKPKAVVGRQEETIHNAIVWVLPNPSGLNAHYQLKDLAIVFRELLIAVRRA
ncbi:MULTISPECIES: G/U mismatch-specific DNA glycosylase [Trichocoleus]|uniref:G/U mismatch-specific DNA glycosylase n=1 Tax=Trichocoleus desertorum GB2-A4 TaxID=2933944 RepID=A0ABV0JAH6_9CYAN|nr:G/U mismatch-specific DNA glycosylase [Trichocoleus sp. FACHB-46]MBD1861501.1 G/U mismatch-specific DNA glycosylase [Trichocoleus sp. FACHB-46]